MSLNTVPDADIELAACYVSDALEGRTEDCSAQMVGRPSWERRMYSLNTWFVWEIWLQLIGIMLMLRAFIEPGYSLSGLECHASPHDGPYDWCRLTCRVGCPCRRRAPSQRRQSRRCGRRATRRRNGCAS